MSLVINRVDGSSVIFILSSGEQIEVKACREGNKTKLVIDAPESVNVIRNELVEYIEMK
ncbi:carbon storage regulator [Aestuariicella sp. G3-2]|uniref:carbon storage regulator n=1 Tax=Pseudomaricurvus albidus TaxID=2842452 RepID=UPI001C0DE30F|nr:carbon storage regulator [Aestuariicella albida]MBU3068788.1 carbon storage regulator [Aestuariicella albida]